MGASITRAVLEAAVVCCLLAACGGHGSAGVQPAAGNENMAPNSRSGAVPGAGSGPEAIESGGTEAAATGGVDIAVLQEQLEKELQRLGIDPAKVAAAAPRGESNAVFDLAAEVADPDGPGGDPPVGIELAWTERCIGDYDQNGLVNASDLTPLGANWQAAVVYDDAAQHEGCEYWPAGDPDDGKAGSAAILAASPASSRRGRSKTGPGRVLDPPLRTSQAAGSGAYNWRLARIDGNANGLLEIADITPIAQHFKEQLSGYRIYRRGPHDANWVWLPDPQDTSSSLTVTRPEAQVGAPVRYEFIDTKPDYPGVYEYYVIAYAAGGAGVSSAEGEAQSNIAQATLILDAVDIYPPIWQGVEGIGSATANEDGTVTVEWGIAVDEEHPPAPASPPVTYNLYYSAETPLDFTSSVRITDAASPWISPQFVNGQEYYFAVRAQDSAAIPNEDQNENELGVTITGGIFDSEPPVWTERYGPQENDFYKGIRSLKVGDGKLEIVCADAADELSPPLHYDLYYVAANDYLSVKGEDGYPILEAQVIKDIPKVFTLYSENRHELVLNVYARDSADPSNIARPFQDMKAAPTDLRKTVLDPFVPGMTEDCTGAKAVVIPDLLRNRVMSVYAQGPDRSSRIVYFLELDIQSGDWKAVQVLADPNAEYGYGNYILALAPNGALWLAVKVYTGPFGVGYNRYFHQPAGGLWSEVELSGPPSGFWNGILDQSDYPVFVSYGGTPEEGEFPLKLHFFEPELDSWRNEVACEYAAYPLAFWRPDGVMQLVTTQSGVSADDIPRYVAERSPEGEWTEVLSGFGKTTALPVTAPHWDAGIAWAVLTTMRGELELLTYGEDGYEFLPVNGLSEYLTANYFDSNKDDPYINQVWSANALYHALPYWLYEDGQFKEFSYRAADELGNWSDGPSHALREAHSVYIFGGRNDNNEDIGQLIWLDPNTGQCAFVGVEDNLITKRQQVYMLTTFGTEASVFDPLTWE